jgi:hypothetical protein
MYFFNANHRVFALQGIAQALRATISECNFRVHDTASSFDIARYNFRVHVTQQASKTFSSRRYW